MTATIAIGISVILAGLVLWLAQAAVHWLARADARNAGLGESRQVPAPANTEVTRKAA